MPAWWRWASFCKVWMSCIGHIRLRLSMSSRLARSRFCFILALLRFPLSSQPFTNREVVLLVASARFKGMEVVSLVCVFPYGFGRPYCLCSLSCFETKGGSFESPKKEKRSHRRWRSRAVGKDAKGTLQVTLASLPRLVSSWTCAGDSLDSKRKIDKSIFCSYSLKYPVQREEFSHLDFLEDFLNTRISM